jgi:ATP-dependent phosphoenolpyruvate carboxykinase
MSFKTRFAEYKASKTTLFWTILGTSGLTMIVGFSGLGWVTAPAAEKMAQDAVDEVRLEFTIAACMQEFFYSENPVAAQAELKDIQSYKREKQVMDNGWIISELAGNKTVEKKAARACVAEILKAEIEIFEMEEMSEEEFGENPIEIPEAEAAIVEVEPVIEEAEVVEEEVEPSISLPVVTQVPAQ